MREEPVKEKERPEKRQKRRGSEDFDKRNNYHQKNKCVCFDTNRKKADIIKLIDEFFKQLKNMIFLEMYDRLEEYYNKFENLLKEKRLSWEKYAYVRKIIRLMLQAQKSPAHDKERLHQLVDAALADPTFCIHDYKHFVLLLESFRNPVFLEEFVLHLAKSSVYTATAVFNLLFFEKFDRKFRKIRQDIFKKIFSNKFYALENFPLLHYIEPQRLSLIDKELTFKIFNRLRFDVMNGARTRPALARFVNHQTVRAFEMNAITYAALVDGVREERPKRARGLANYLQRLSSELARLEGRKLQLEFFEYDVLLVLNVFDLGNEPMLADKVCELLYLLESKLTLASMFGFAHVCSLAGNILFRHRHFEQAVKCKSAAFETVKNLGKVEVQFPPYVRPIEPKSLIFDIFSYLF